MLKTLLKYEWKDTWGLGTTCNGIALILSVIGSLMISLWHYSDDKSFTDTQMAMLGVGLSFYVIIYVVSVFAIALVMKYYFFIRYYKNLFTDQGYLMHTLPVKSTDLINAKLIIAVLWQFITCAVLVGCLMMLFFSFGTAIGDMTMHDVFEAFHDMEIVFEEIVKEIPLIVSSIICSLMTPILEILLMYVAVGIGQLSKKNRLFLSVLVLIGIYIGKRFLLSMLMVPFQLAIAEEDFSATSINVVSVFGTLAVIGITVGLYFLNKYFLEQKLNLE
ncbi:MAG: hypothetical protein PUE95_07365 [Lachnospiraceae bacterium]|nr:hypothetical protein [Lachnospiraceae bacterium]